MPGYGIRGRLGGSGRARARLIALTTPLAALLAAPLAAMAQGLPTVSEPTARSATASLPALEARLDSLLADVDRYTPRADAEREAYDASTRATLAKPVRRAVEGLTIRALPRDIGAATDLFVSTWREVFAPTFGPPPAALRDVGLGYYDHRGEWNPRIGEDQSWGYYVQVQSSLDDREHQAVRALSLGLLGQGPVSVYHWLGYDGFDPRTDELTARRQLAATRSRSVTLCLEGDVTACAVSLGVRPAGWDADDVVRAWYDTETLTALLSERRRTGASLGPDPDAARFFVDLRPAALEIDDQGTRRVVRPAGRHIRHDAGPATPATRASLWMLALELGGPGALDRALRLDRDMPLEAVLAATSGHSIHDLVAIWRNRLTDEENPTRRRTPTRSTLTWIGLLAVFSMTSTRWRVGR